MNKVTKFKIARIKSGITQWELAGALGCAEMTVSRWETGRVDFPKERAVDVALLLKCEPEDLL